MVVVASVLDAVYPIVLAVIPVVILRSWTKAKLRRHLLRQGGNARSEWSRGHAGSRANQLCSFLIMDRGDRGQYPQGG